MSGSFLRMTKQHGLVMFGHRLISHSSKLRYLETAHDCLIGVIALNNAFFGLFGGILKLDPYHPIPMCVFIGSY